jgi:hypothetical protein
VELGGEQGHLLQDLGDGLAQHEAVLGRERKPGRTERTRDVGVEDEV